ncbi:Sorbosone dehydrogenase-domain-containing protein [Paraphysoderma sedebokerense]|nr:Sorbosone dehydrogenase-domain-containing protein [Paraphysoderma sedebokerense]
MQKLSASFLGWVLSVLGFFLIAAYAQVSAPNWVFGTAWENLDQPISVKFAPNGRAFINLKGGVLLTTSSSNDPIVRESWDLSQEVFNNFDKGFLGLAIPPNYAASPRVYGLFTADKGPNQISPVYNDRCASNICATTASLVVIYVDENGIGQSQQTIWSDSTCVHSTTHDVGQINFDSAGNLYLTNGEGSFFDPVLDFGRPPATCPNVSASDTSIDPAYPGGAFRSQANSSPQGKVLRFSAASLATAESSRTRATPVMIAKGFRNPYRTYLDTATNELWIGDVGGGTFEEINRLTGINTLPGNAATPPNFGWPCREALLVRDYASFGTTCSAARFQNVQAPAFAFQHGQPLGVNPQTVPADGQSAISGILVYKSPTNFLRNGLFFSDYARGGIWYFPAPYNFGAQPQTILTAAPGIVDMTEGLPLFIRSSISNSFLNQNSSRP